LRKNRAINNKIDLAVGLLKIERKILGKSHVQSSKKKNSFFVHLPFIDHGQLSISIGKF
jgi:hypothetical protein